MLIWLNKFGKIISFKWFNKLIILIEKMAFNPFNLFKGNPKVLELMEGDKNISDLLLEQSFVSEFKKTENDNLQKYMNYDRYAQLIKYITIIECNQSNKNRAFKFPYVASEILSVCNELTFKYLLEEVVFTEEVVEEQIEVEKQMDSQSSDRSYSSIKSNNSNTSKKQAFENKQYEQSDKENFILRDENDKTLADYEFKDEKDICEEDFPDVRPKKIIMVRQLVKKTVKRPLQPLVFSLLKYFQNATVVHILDGYVCKVLDNIINNRLVAFLKIMDKYGLFNQIKRIFSHLQSNSVQQFIINFTIKLRQSQDPIASSEEILLIQFIQKICEIPYCQWPNNQAILEEKAYILNLYCSIVQKIITKLSSKVQSEQHKQDKNFKSQLKQAFELIRAQHISRIIQILGELIRKSKASFAISKIILCYCRLIKLILKTFTITRSIQQSIANKLNQDKQIKIRIEACEDCFDPIIQTAYAYIFQDVLHIQKQDLSSYKFANSLISKMEFIQILGLLAKENIYFSKRTIIDHPHFEYCLQLLEYYPKSSIFHNGILNIILPLLALSNEDIIIQKFFSKQNFFSTLLQIVQKDSQLRYEKKDRNRKCYIAQITSICIAIQKLQHENIQLNQYKQSEQWQFISQYLIKDEKGLQRKVLGGHEKQRNKKPQICFSKQECLQKFKHFLSGLKLNHFDEFQNYEPNNSDSEQEKDREQREKGQLLGQQTKISQTEQVEDNSKYFAQDYVL